MTVVWGDDRAEALGLPHLPLAEEIGRRHTAGQMLVTVMDEMIDPRMIACCIPSACVVVLSPAAGTFAWRHELGHLLDPLREWRSRAQREWWADTVADHLRLCPESTVDDVLSAMADNDPGVLVVPPADVPLPRWRVMGTRIEGGGNRTIPLTT